MIVLTALTNYGVDDIKPFVESLNQSGYIDKKVAIIYNIGEDTVQYLKQNGWELYQGVLQEHIIVQRFVDCYHLLSNYENEVVFWTDIKDVVFQLDPKSWISQNFEKDKYELYAFSECIKLEDDPWACINSGTTFPLEWQWNKNNLSHCAGTILGHSCAIKDLFIEIYRWAKTSSNPEQLSDQAAYNILIRLNHFKQIVKLIEQERGFVTQLGTVWCKKEEFRGKLTEPTPSLKNNLICNSKGEPFSVIHQYDRDSQLKQMIHSRYK